MKRELTCIVCPKGCTLTAEKTESGEIAVTGHTCKRGQEYAISECTHPVRTLTTTAPLEGGGVIPVKTNAPVPKEMMLLCIAEINRTYVPKGMPLGFTVIKNLLGTGADVVTTRDDSQK